MRLLAIILTLALFLPPARTVCVTRYDRNGAAVCMCGKVDEATGGVLKLRAAPKAACWLLEANR